ncbi:MAG: hypothetical protein AB2693_34015 [Candidatus Thiodiazotropha sp.]
MTEKMLPGTLSIKPNQTKTSPTDFTEVHIYMLFGLLGQIYITNRQIVKQVCVEIFTGVLKTLVDMLSLERFRTSHRPTYSSPEPLGSQGELMKKT